MNIEPVQANDPYLAVDTYRVQDINDMENTTRRPIAEAVK